MQDGGKYATIRDVCLTTPPFPPPNRWKGIYSPFPLDITYTLAYVVYFCIDCACRSQQTYYYIALDMYNALESTGPLHCLIDPRELLHHTLYTAQF